MVYFLCKASDSGRQNCCFALSLPVRGAWVEIPERPDSGRSRESLPVRGAWAEIPACIVLLKARTSLPVRGAWIEISTVNFSLSSFFGRSPCGEHGLKLKGQENP